MQVNHSYSESAGIMVMSYPKDSVLQHSSHPPALTVFPPFSELFPDSRQGVNIDVLFTAEHSIGTVQHINRFNESLH